jgi:hypothetical protein
LRKEKSHRKKKKKKKKKNYLIKKKKKKNSILFLYFIIKMNLVDQVTEQLKTIELKGKKRRANKGTGRLI